MNWGRLLLGVIATAIFYGIVSAIGRRKARALLRGDPSALKGIPERPINNAGCSPCEDKILERQAAQEAAEYGWNAAAKVFSKAARQALKRGNWTRARYLDKRARSCTGVEDRIKGRLICYFLIAGFVIWGPNFMYLRSLLSTAGTPSNALESQPRTELQPRFHAQEPPKPSWQDPSQPVTPSDRIRFWQRIRANEPVLSPPPAKPYL